MKRATPVLTMIAALAAAMALLASPAFAAAGPPTAGAATGAPTGAGAIKLAPPASTAPDAQQCDIAYQRYGACYDYAGAPAQAPNEGASVSFPVSAPPLAYNGYHSLIEMAVFNRTAAGIDQDTAEIGWIVDSESSDQPPVAHLFVYHFVNTKGTCYDGCGFVSTSSTIKPGMALTPGTQVTWAIHNIDHRWTFFLNGTEFGYIPDSAYHGTFSQAAQVNVYGEIAGQGDTPGCTQMGNGLFGTQSAADTINHFSLFDATTSPRLTPYSPTDPAAWNSATTAAGFRVGGPGACAPMAGTIANADGGYTVVGQDTSAYTFTAGENPWYRPSTPPAPQDPGAGQIVAVTRDPATGGYWMTDDQGDVYAVNAPSYGGLNGVQTPAPIVGIAAVGSGYVLVTAKGNTYAFNAPTYPGVANLAHAPVVGIAPSGTGYLIATSAGRVFAVHTGHPAGSAPALPGPVTAIAADGSGYLLTDAHGDVAAVGAPKLGSLHGTEIPEPIIAITATNTGYVLTDAFGEVYAFGTPFDGSVTNEGI